MGESGCWLKQQQQQQQQQMACSLFLESVFYHMMTFGISTPKGPF